MFGSRRWKGGELKQRRETVGLFLSFLSSFSASLGEILMRSWKEEEEFAVGAVKNMTVNHIHAKFAGNCFSRTKILISGQRSGQNLFLDKILVCMFWQILRFANVLCAEASHLFSPFSRSLGQFSRRRDFIFSRSFAGRQRVLCCFCLLRPKFRLHITHPSPSRFFWACMQKQARPPSSSSSSPGKQTETQKSFLFSKRGN